MGYLSFHKKDNLSSWTFYHLNNLPETYSRSSAYVKLGSITTNGKLPFFDYEVLEIQKLLIDHLLYC